MMADWQVVCGLRDPNHHHYEVKIFNDKIQPKIMTGRYYTLVKQSPAWRFLKVEFLKAPQLRDTGEYSAFLRGNGTS